MTMVRGNPELNTSGRCHLLELPGEVHNQIIELSLVSINDPDEVQLFYSDGEEFIQPAISKTNRQLRNETLGLYYATKTFGINTVQVPQQRQVAKRWFKAVEAYLPQITTIRISLCDLHFIFVWIHAAPGKATSFKLMDFDGASDGGDGTDRCQAARTFVAVKNVLLQICRIVGNKEFGRRNTQGSLIIRFSVVSTLVVHEYTSYEDKEDDGEEDGAHFEEDEYYGRVSGGLSELEDPEKLALHSVLCSSGRSAH